MLNKVHPVLLFSSIFQHFIFIWKRLPI